MKKVSAFLKRNNFFIFSSLKSMIKHKYFYEKVKFSFKLTSYGILHFLQPAD